jgi:outer membrane protein assembly factor BamB
VINAMNHQVKRLVTAFLIGSLAFTFIGCSGSARVRKPAELTPVTNQFEMLPVWTTNVGSSEKFNFHPAVAGDGVYAASHNGTVTKVDLATGKKMWEASVPERLAIGPGTDGSITVVVGIKGTVYAFDDSGKSIWKVNIASEVLSEPVVSGGVVVVRALDNRFLGLDAKTGVRKWIYQRPQAA